MGGVIVNCMCQPDWATGTHILGHTLFSVCVEGVFWVRSLSELVGRVRQHALPNTGGPLPITRQPQRSKETGSFLS